MTLEELAGRLDTLASRAGEASLEGLAGPLESMATSAVKENFFRASSPEGTAWAPRKGAPKHPPLRKTGQMFGSILAGADRRGVRVSADSPAGFHTRGTRRMPARPFLGFAPVWLQRMAGAVAEHESQQLVRTFA